MYLWYIDWNQKTTLHYTTLHYTTLHYTTLHYTTLHYTTLHYTTLHYTALHYTTLQYTTLHSTLTPLTIYSGNGVALQSDIDAYDIEVCFTISTTNINSGYTVFDL